MSYSDVVIADGPSSYWKLDGNALDSVGNRTGTIVGSPVLDTDKTPDGLSCFNFNGSTQFIKFTDPSLLQGSSQTLEVILRNKKPAAEFTSMAVVGQVFSRMNRATSPYPQMSIRYGYRAGSFSGTHVSGLTTEYAQDACAIAITPFTDAWHHIVFAITDKSAAIYVDGAFVGRQNLSYGPPTLPSNEPTTIGGRDDGVQLFKGNIAHAAWYAKELTPQQIYNHAQVSGLTAPWSGVSIGSTSRTMKQPDYSLPLLSGVRIERNQKALILPGGDFYNGPGVLSGNVFIDQPPKKPTARQVGLYLCQTRQLLRLTWSDPITGTYRFDRLDMSQAYFVVAWDYENNYNAVIADNIKPVIQP